MKDLHEKGVTIILSCHEAYLVDALADKVFEINNQYWKEDTKRLKLKKQVEEVHNSCVIIKIVRDQKALPTEFVKRLDKEYVRITSEERDITVLYVARNNAQKILAECIRFELEVLDLHNEATED